MIALAHWIALSAGWPRRLIALFCGACGALAMAPVDAFPAMVVPMTAAVWLLDGADRAPRGGTGWRAHLWPSLTSAAGTGWWWGLGYFVSGLWWLGAATLVEPDKFAWALPISVLGVPAILALFTGLGFAVSRLLWMPGAGRILSLTLGLGLAEWLRSVLFTGFPWNEYGMALGNILVLAQLGSVVGLHGLTLLTVALCAAPATLADGEGPAGPGGWRRILPPALALAGLCAVAIFGALRLANGHVGTVAGVRLRIMQPDVPQDAAFTYANGQEILRRYLALSDKATSATTSGLSDVTHLIWPESPFPFILSRQPEAIDAITAALPAGAVLITGAARAEGEAGASPPPRYYNSIQVLTSDGSIVDSYDKVHLVPFGEYVPFEWILGRLGVEHFVDIPGGFTAGTHHRLLNAPGLPPIIPAICYEAIFPDEITAGIRRSSPQGLILNLTNDGWFGNTSGPYQHFAQARLRAIEEGLPLIRAANTGISAIVDPYGRILASLPVGVANVLDGPLPDALKRTPFGRFHELAAFVISALLLTMVVVLKYRRSRFAARYDR
ncbi:MAG TPA: apolipoprotein N-acyltransferase [Lichenihabitans sp.]|jgi:apolipoprotein N-acyltransferase|nr:apolipoprotein N-acyltransferase [Lichenihabitans sp.]